MLERIQPLSFIRSTSQNLAAAKSIWCGRAVKTLNNFEKRLDLNIPNFPIQTRLDAIGHYITSVFAPLTEFNQWLNDNGHGDWCQQLATSLAKLPLRAIRNIVQQLYTLIKGIAYTTVHPLKGTTHFAKHIISIIEALTTRENWPKIGASLLGATLGQGLVTGNPLSVIGLGIGAALLISGVELQKAETLAESALTGFFTGILMGTIQRAMQPRNYMIKTQQEAEHYANAFIKENNLPPCSKVWLCKGGAVELEWNWKDLQSLHASHPETNFVKTTSDFEIITKTTVTLAEQGACVEALSEGYFLGGGYLGESCSLSDVGLTQPAYPIAPENVAFSQYGPLVAITPQRNPKRS